MRTDHGTTRPLADLRRYHLAAQLRRADHALTTALGQALDTLGITLAQANVLLFIDRFPRTTMPRVAELAAVTPQAMHRTVVGLERRGWLVRARLPGDEKTFRLSLTPAGRRMLAQAEERVTTVQDRTAGHLDPAEIDQLHDLLRRYEAAFLRGVGA